MRTCERVSECACYCFNVCVRVNGSTVSWPLRRVCVHMCVCPPRGPYVVYVQLGGDGEGLLHAELEHLLEGRPGTRGVAVRQRADQTAHRAGESV